MSLHNGTWNKVSKGCWEIRGKTVGIVGYGHIGSQLSVLAESMGMSVIYYDVLNLMALGTARQVGSLDDLLSVRTLSVCMCGAPETKNLNQYERVAQMRNGSYLINNSRGSVVDISALIEAMKGGKIAGAALDVYPNEPAGNGDYFTNDLNLWTEGAPKAPESHPTPHIGGSNRRGPECDLVSRSVKRWCDMSTRGTTLEQSNAGSQSAVIDVG